jgi:hypothetical protein
MTVSVESVVSWAVKLPDGYHEEHNAFIFNVSLSVVRMWPGYIYIYIYIYGLADMEHGYSETIGWGDVEEPCPFMLPGH